MQDRDLYSITACINDLRIMFGDDVTEEFRTIIKTHSDPESIRDAYLLLVDRELNRS